MASELGTFVKEIVGELRKGLGEDRNIEFSKYVDDLIRAKEAGVDISTITPPMLLDNTFIGIQGSVASKAKGGAEGGIAWQFITLKGSYSRESETGLTVRVDSNFRSSGVVDFDRVAQMSVEELRSLRTLINA